MFSNPNNQMGGRDLDNISQTRSDYINALRKADAGDLNPLLALYSHNAL